MRKHNTQTLYTVNRQYNETVACHISCRMRRDACVWSGGSVQILADIESHPNLFALFIRSRVISLYFRIPRSGHTR